MRMIKTQIEITRKFKIIYLQFQGRSWLQEQLKNNNFSSKQEKNYDEFDAINIIKCYGK